MSKTAYYARPMSIYGTPQESRDMETIRALGYEPIDINKEELQERAKAEGMAVFKPLVDSAQALFFRSFMTREIGAGVGKEIAWAQEGGMPVVELPSGLSARVATVERTRELLSESGQR